jgi:hypothetical protein
MRRRRGRITGVLSNLREFFYGYRVAFFGYRTAAPIATG